MAKTIREIQQRLKDLGCDPGEVDGARGRMTIAAVKRFQKSRNLEVDGLVGPNTMKALFGVATATVADSPDRTPWMDIALRTKGLHEKIDNKALKAFLKSDGATVGDPAQIPWCGDFVQTCLALAMPEEPLPTNPYAAINWLTFGKEASPQYGAILIFWRGSPDGWQGHIAFYLSEDATHYHVLGGNQTNGVTESKISKSRLRKNGCRMPLTALSMDGASVIADGSAIVETKNEA